MTSSSTDQPNDIEVVEAQWPGPWPVPGAIDAEYWRAAAEGKLLVQSCPACGHRQHYPRLLCTRCGATPEWLEASGDATIYSFTVVHQMGLHPFNERVPYVVCLVDLDEGPRVMGNVVDCEPAAVCIGARVRAVMHRFNEDFAAVQWRLAVAQ